LFPGGKFAFFLTMTPLRARVMIESNAKVRSRRGVIRTTSFPQRSNTGQADRDMIDRFQDSEEPKPCGRLLAEEAVFVGGNVPCSDVGQEIWAVCCWVEWVEIHYCVLSDWEGSFRHHRECFKYARMINRERVMESMDGQSTPKSGDHAGIMSISNKRRPYS